MKMQDLYILAKSKKKYKILDIEIPREGKKKIQRKNLCGSRILLSEYLCQKYCFENFCAIAVEYLKIGADWWSKEKLS